MTSRSNEAVLELDDGRWVVREGTEAGTGGRQLIGPDATSPPLRKCIGRRTNVCMETIPLRGVFMWWPRHALAFDSVMEELVLLRPAEQVSKHWD